MNKVLEFLKKNVKLTVTIVVLGIAATLGFGANGCDVSVAPDPAAQTTPAPEVVP